jgi:hypothetical protein
MNIEYILKLNLSITYNFFVAVEGLKWLAGNSHQELLLVFQQRQKLCLC